MERQEEILTVCQEELPKEILLRCREFLSTHTLDGDDPLEGWYQYIRWAEQHFPENGRTENIQKLLHTCLNKFNSSEEYFQDVRFIKLWLKYAEVSENPLQVYNQLSLSGIGVQCAMFYKSWAEELFQNGDFKKADKVFREGLKRRAQPLNKLQSAYGNFHIAVARRILDETKMHAGSDAEKWADYNFMFGGKTLESSSEVSTGETQLITTNILKPVENLPSRFASKCSKVGEKAVNRISPERSETQIGKPERNTKQVSNVQSCGKKTPGHGTRLGTSHNDYKSKVTDGFQCRIAVFEVPNPSQRPRYPKEKVYADNTEYSLEELRAANYVRKDTNTDRGILADQTHSGVNQRSLLTSVVDKKSEAISHLGHKNPINGTEENFSLCNPACDDAQPTVNFSCRNAEKTEPLHSAVAHQHSHTRDFSKSPASNIPTIEILTVVPPTNLKETSPVPDCENICSNQHHEKGHSLSAEPDFSKAKEAVSSASARNITLRTRNDSCASGKHQVHHSNHIDIDGSGNAVHTHILLHKAEIFNESGHHITEPKDLEEKQEDNNNLQSVSHHFKYEIPFVPSPGMTIEEIKHLKGTENKENEGEVPNIVNKYEMLPPPECKIMDRLSQRTSLQEHATVFGVVDAKFVDNDFVEVQPRQSALFSDSRISQMFARTLISSTPARKSVFHLANSNRMKSIANAVQSTSSEEKQLLSVAGGIQHETDKLPFSPHTVSSENRVSFHPVHDPSCRNKSHTITEVEEHHNFQSRVIHQGHSYRDSRSEINPFDDVLISQLLHHIGFVANNKGDWLKVLSKPTPRIRLPFTLKVDNDVYQVVKEIGKGSYARILCATDNDGERVALKVQKPSWLWEAYIEDQIQRRIKDENLGLCFANPSKVYEYSDGSIMVHEYLKYGSILNFITEARKVNRALNENVIFCFMCKIIEAVQSLHNCKIIHGDLKPDNILIRSVYPPSIQLIDFGRAIDMTLFPPETTFTYAVTTKDFQCTEMQAKKPWTYQTDIFGLLSTAHCFLFGEYMKVSLKGGKWVIQKSLPRSCHKHLWSQFFHDLLNIESCDKLPDLSYWEAAMQQEIDVTVLNKQLIVIKNVMDGY